MDTWKRVGRGGELGGDGQCGARDRLDRYNGDGEVGDCACPPRSTEGRGFGATWIVDIRPVMDVYAALSPLAQSAAEAAVGRSTSWLLKYRLRLK